ncbi:MAG: tetratricopeptide repeat protein, partial [candidate division Zixibacteria bacterium]|nr:tetratricopeptide repeat protein [candidate division Zixibacteria bacterium]
GLWNRIGVVKVDPKRKPCVQEDRRFQVKKMTTTILAALVCSVYILSGVAAVAGEVGKIPLSTKSDRALEYYLRGRSLAEKLRGQESRRYFQEAINEDPNFAMAYFQLAFAQPSTKGFFESFNKALSLIDNVSEGEKLMILGSEAGDINRDPTTQRKLFRQLVDIYPNDERAHNLLANHYFGQQMYELAIIEYERVIKINPTFSQSYNQLGYAYRFLGRYDDAEQAFKNYIELIPDDPNPYDSYAELLMKMGRFEESIANYKKALKVNPDFAFSHVGIASNLTYMGDHRAALKRLQKMYDASLDDGQRRIALASMAVCYVDSGEIDLALAQLRRQLKLAEAINDTAAMANDNGIIAFVQIETGESGDAKANFDKALALIEESSLSDEVKDLARLGYLFSMARVHIVNGNLEEAKVNATEYANRAGAAHNPLQVRQAHQLMGMIALEEADFRTAIQEFMQSDQQNPYNFYRMAIAYEGSGDREKARELYDKAANYNIVNNFNYALIRIKAREKLALL